MVIDKRLFREVNASVAGQEIVKMLGLDCQNGFILCPEHSDTHPSCKIYNDGYYCHVCHAHGDNIHLVALKEGISDTEALKKINTYFSLGFNLEKSTAEKTSPVPKEDPRQLLREWVKKTTGLLCWWCRALGQIVTTEEASRFRNVAEFQQSYLEGVLDNIACLSPEEAYKQYKEIEHDYHQFTRQYGKLRCSGLSRKESIRRLLGCSEGVCRDTDTAV